MISQKLPGYDLPMGAPANWDEDRDGPCNVLMVKADFEDHTIEHPHLAGADPKTYTETIRKYRYCESAWKPTPDELAMLNAGGHVVLHVVGRQPPVALWVESEGT